MTAIQDYAETFTETPGYLNWAAFGPLSTAARAATVADSALLSTGRPAALAAVWARVDEARAGLAALLGAQADDVTLQVASSPGLQHALTGLSGKVMASTAEFPSVTVTIDRAAAASRGTLTARWFSPPRTHVTPEAVAEALDADVTALVVSHVDFRSGYRADLAGLREVLGPDRLLIVDAVQSFGVVEEDYAVADVVVGHGYKWLRAGRGTGFARFTAVARERIVPVLSGFTATTAPGFFVDEIPDAAASGQAYATSSPDHLAAGRLSAGLAEIRAVGVRSVADRLAANVDAVIEIADRHGVPVVSPREQERRAGIVVLEPEDPAGFGAVLADAGVTVTVRTGSVRVAPHAGTGAETLAMFDDAVAAAAKFTRR
ncbi:selenocysteine lyase/cysteine desulfurase [Microbacterium resistens]|uniref:Selenocysteine lyase/cysteine desulfurase n=1 Tax=Microbacterium resistens TaxID=156977 RepID=A0ABU1S9N5_9MICO|nr:aminotransferase [Microbacterium resistens]MDR6865613.1 selenocysteine lyase/cysteine desulfurase [Microbacterium resistens]